jgi:hypothetical protein
VENGINPGWWGDEDGMKGGDGGEGEGEGEGEVKMTEINMDSWTNS